MNNCPFCNVELEDNAVSCPMCHAKKGYFRFDNIILGKKAFILMGLIVPSVVALFAIAAQNPLGFWSSIVMSVLVLFAIIKLLIGKQWFKVL